MKPLVKICGLMRPEDVELCCKEAVEICGFVTEYPLDVPWNLTKEQCARLLRYVSEPAKSCIVTGGETEKIISLGLALRPGYVQLHYRESLDMVREIVETLKPFGIKVIKTVPHSAKERMEQFGTDCTESCVEQLCAAGVGMILVDSRSPANAAVGGGLGDMEFYQRVKKAATCPVMLGGGITPENCQRILETVKPDGIDILSGVEASVGVKREDAVERVVMVANKKRCCHQNTTSRNLIIDNHLLSFKKNFGAWIFKSIKILKFRK